MIIVGESLIASSSRNEAENRVKWGFRTPDIRERGESYVGVRLMARGQNDAPVLRNLRIQLIPHHHISKEDTTMHYW